LRKRGQGTGILVSMCPKETNASYSLQDPAEVRWHTHIMQHDTISLFNKLLVPTSQMIDS
jgi:hypothetical protein